MATLVKNLQANEKLLLEKQPGQLHLKLFVSNVWRLLVSDNVGNRGQSQ
jgi:hypothetical protein